MSQERQVQRENLRRFLKEGEKRQSPFYTLKASQKRLLLTAKLFMKAYDKDSIVAWRNPFVPTEIFYAMNIVPFCIEAFSSMLAGSSLSRKVLDTSDDNYYSRDVCSFLRCAIGAAIEDYLPTPDFLVCTSYYCDSGSRTFYNLSKKYKKDYFFLDIPYHYDSEEAIESLAFQIENMVQAIGDRIGKKISSEKLSEAIIFSNEARSYFIKANELRRNIPAPMSGREAIDYAALVAYTWGSQEIVEVYKLLYEELKERVEKHIGAVEGEKYRLLWRHLRPYYDDTIMGYLENQCNAVIAFEEINYVLWNELDDKNPYQSLAREILANPGIGHIQHWIDTTLNFVQRYDIDGVIEFAHWGCRHLNSAANILKEELDKREIPFLVLDSDCIDERNFSWEQIRTRIDAFLEVLAQMKR